MEITDGGKNALHTESDEEKILHQLNVNSNVDFDKNKIKSYYKHSDWHNRSRSYAFFFAGRNVHSVFRCRAGRRCQSAVE